MNAVIQVRKEGKWYVATDLITQVADQGRTREEAVRGLVKGLRERQEALVGMGATRTGTRSPAARPS